MREKGLSRTTGPTPHSVPCAAGTRTTHEQVVRIKPTASHAVQSLLLLGPSSSRGFEDRLELHRGAPKPSRPPQPEPSLGARRVAGVNHHRAPRVRLLTHSGSHVSPFFSASSS